MDRRDFIGHLALGTLVAPRVANAQAARKVYRIGILGLGQTSRIAGPQPLGPDINAFLRGLRELGYVYGEQFVTEPRGAAGRPELFPILAAEPVRLQVDVIVAARPALPARRAREWTFTMKPRAVLILALALAFVAAPLVARAQEAGRVTRIGYLSLFEPRSLDDVFRQGMRDLGWVEGQNLVIEYRSAGRDPRRLRPLAEELVRLRVALIVTASGRAALVAKEVTSSIPLVMAGSGDAVGAGIVSSLARPGGNVTGTTNVSPETVGKRLELLKETVPRLSRVAFLGCLESAGGRRESKEVRVAAATLRLKVQAVDVPRVGGLKSALEKVIGQRSQALLVGDCPSSFEPRQLAELALQHRLPTMVTYANYVHAGSLMTYAPSQAEQARRAASYVDKILKGAKPGDLPVEQPTKFELVINLKTAKALGLTIPPSLLLRADEVIE